MLTRDQDRMAATEPGGPARMTMANVEICGSDANRPGCAAAAAVEGARVGFEAGEREGTSMCAQQLCNSCRLDGARRIVCVVACTHCSRSGIFGAIVVF